MNRWKRELDQVTSDFKEEKERMLQVVLTKRSKKRQKQIYKLSAIASILVTIIGIFMYSQLTATDKAASLLKKYDLQFSTEETPVYKDEKLLQLYKAFFSINVDDSAVNEGSTSTPSESISDDYFFQIMIFNQGMEYLAYNAGFTFIGEDYLKAWEDVEKTWSEWELKENNGFLLENNMSLDFFKDEIYMPIMAKNRVVQNYLQNDASFKEYEVSVKAFLNKFDDKIKNLATEMGVQYDMDVFLGISQEDSRAFEGTIIALDTKRMLVVKDLTDEDFEMLTVDQIVEKYQDVLWFEFDDYISVDIGNKVAVYYNEITHKPFGVIDEAKAVTFMLIDE